MWNSIKGWIWKLGALGLAIITILSLFNIDSKFFFGLSQILMAPAFLLVLVKFIRSEDKAEARRQAERQKGWECQNCRQQHYKYIPFQLKPEKCSRCYGNNLQKYY